MSCRWTSAQPLHTRPIAPPVSEVVLGGERDRLAGQTLGPLHIPAIEMERCGAAQGLGQGMAVRGFLGEAERHVARALRLLGIAERPEHPGIDRTAVHLEAEMR